MNNIEEDNNYDSEEIDNNYDEEIDRKLMIADMVEYKKNNKIYEELKTKHNKDKIQIINSNMITIYVLFHSQLEDTNIFTTKKERVEDLMKSMAEKTNTNISDWEVREFIEEQEFEANFTDY